MEDVAIFVAIAICFGVVYALVEYVFRRLSGELASRLHGVWRWLVLPLVAAVAYGAFVVLRPFVLDKPPSVHVMIGGLVEIALLVIIATALASAVLQLLRLRPPDD
jgi:uncharacterized BrkB/YihY/UPF0761 family membrane protein